MLSYPLEVPHRGASNEYAQYMFSWRNKKNINTCTYYSIKGPHMAVAGPSQHCSGHVKLVSEHTHTF